MPLKDMLLTETPICPSFLSLLKPYISLTKDKICIALFDTKSPWENIVMEIKWTTWSPPDQLLHQFMEWEPLTNIYNMALYTSTLFPQISFTIAFFMVLITLVSLSLASLMFNHRTKLANIYMYEMSFLSSISQNKKKLFPSPNYKQEAMAKWFRPISWAQMPLALLKLSETQ